MPHCIVSSYYEAMNEVLAKDEVVYQSSTHPTQGWDVVQVVYLRGGKIANSFVIALAADGTIRRKTDILYDWWEIVTDENDLKGFRSLFSERDRLLAEQATKAGIPATS